MISAWRGVIGDEVWNAQLQNGVVAAIARRR